MRRTRQRRCSSCGGSRQDPLFWWLCTGCRRRIEGTPVDLDEDEMSYGHGGRGEQYGAAPEDKRVYRLLYSRRTIAHQGEP